MAILSYGLPLRRIYLKLAASRALYLELPKLFLIGRI